MPISIQLRGPGVRSAEVEAVVASAYEDLAWVDRTFSRWKPDSELSRLRRGELALADACPQLGEVAELCERYREQTQGWFTAWLPEEGTGRPAFDPTGLVKGWAIRRAAALLAELPEHAYCVNAGGDIAVGGRAPGPEGERPWRLGIEDPDDRSVIARVVELRQGALATSGCAARGAHLIDPHSGRPVLRRGSVSVIAPDIVEADVWATALFVAPPELQDRLDAAGGCHVVRL